MDIRCEKRGNVAVAFMKGVKARPYEDAFRILNQEVPVVKACGRGELFGIFDGIGSAEKGRAAAQGMAGILDGFFLKPGQYSASPEGIQSLLMEGNMLIHSWGFKAGTDVPLGGCAGTVAWLNGEDLYLFHAGDTVALLNRRGETSVLTRLHQLESGAIFRYFGLGPNLQIDVSQLRMEDLDRIILLTDGVTKVLHPLDAGAISEEYDDLSVAAKSLVQRARSLGSRDDITAIVIEFEAI